jgi:hypothetical protein
MWFFHVKFAQALSKFNAIKAQHTDKTSIALRRLEDIVLRPCKVRLRFEIGSACNSSCGIFSTSDGAKSAT